jgi:septum formation protein
MRTLILASTSKPRYHLLQQLKIPFQCVPPQVDETPQPNETAENLVIRLASEKAIAVARRHPDALVIGADQVGVVDNTMLCKPLTHDQAVRQLTQMSGKTLRFLTGLCLVDPRNGTAPSALETFDIQIRHLTPAMIKHYLENEDVLQCAGSFRLEGLGITLVEKMQGDDYTAIIGLPLIRLTRWLEAAGLETII